MKHFVRLLACIFLVTSLGALPSESEERFQESADLEVQKRTARFSKEVLYIKPEEFSKRINSRKELIDSYRSRRYFLVAMAVASGLGIYKYSQSKSRGGSEGSSSFPGGASDAGSVSGGGGEMEAARGLARGEKYLDHLGNHIKGMLVWIVFIPIVTIFSELARVSFSATKRALSTIWYGPNRTIHLRCHLDAAAHLYHLRHTFHGHVYGINRGLAANKQYQMSEVEADLISAYNGVVLACEMYVAEVVGQLLVMCEKRSIPKSAALGMADQVIDLLTEASDLFVYNLAHKNFDKLSQRDMFDEVMQVIGDLDRFAQDVEHHGTTS